MIKKINNKKRILNCTPSHDTEKDWHFDNASDAGILAAPQTIPKSKDLREVWWKIGDQGQTGSCVGWAATDSVLRWHFVKAGKLSKDESLSVRFIWMASKETDEYVSYPSTFLEIDGTSPKAALDIARKFGAVTNSVLPFNSGQLYQDKAQTFYAKASQLKISSYYNLGKKLSDWRTWLAQKGPILTRLDVDSTWYGASSTKGKLDTYHPPPGPAGHAVALVGFTQDRFIVRNSWGTSWGDKGFAYASDQYADDAFTEAYGVIA